MSTTYADPQPLSPLPPARHWTGRSRGGFVGNWIFTVLARRCGLWWAYALLLFVTPYYLLCSARIRRASMAYQRRLWPGRGYARRLLGAYRHIFAFGQILIDRVAVPGNAEAFQFVFEGEAHLRAALAGGKGAILITAHVGNWEAAAHLLQRLETPVNVVALEAEEARLRRYFDKVLDNQHVKLIPANGSADTGLAIMAALARGELVAMQADRSLDAQEEAIPFLGAPARFPIGPFVAAAVSGAPLVQAFAMRTGAYRYHFRAYAPETLAFADRRARRAQCREWMGRFVQRLEETLRQHPLQWNNFYDFWKQEAGR